MSFCGLMIIYNEGSLARFHCPSLLVLNDTKEENVVAIMNNVNV